MAAPSSDEEEVSRLVELVSELEDDISYAHTAKECHESIKNFIDDYNAMKARSAPSPDEYAWLKVDSEVPERLRPYYGSVMPEERYNFLFSLVSGLITCSDVIDFSSLVCMLDECCGVSEETDSIYQGVDDCDCMPIRWVLRHIRKDLSDEASALLKACLTTIYGNKLSGESFSDRNTDYDDYVEFDSGRSTADKHSDDVTPMLLK